METCDYPPAMARRYDRDYASMGRTHDVDFYVELARQVVAGAQAASKSTAKPGSKGEPNAAPPSILEVACGTGRVLLPIARALAADKSSATVTGVEPSAEMRAQLMAKLTREPEAVRGRVSIFAGRFDRIPVPTRFTLVCSAFRAFQHLQTAAEQQAAVTSMAAALAPGGTLAFDTFDYNPVLAARPADVPDCAYDEDGRHIERRSVRQLDETARSVHLELRWYADGVPTGERAACSMKIVTRDELAALVARAGLQLVDIYGDFDRSPHDAARARELVVVATKPA